VLRFTRVGQPLGERWKNHILPKEKDSNHANVALAHDPTILGEALECNDASK
jgi:hypothetical protein